MIGSQDEARQVGIVTRETLLAEDGLRFLDGIMKGRHPFPPFADLLELKLVEIESGRAVYLGKPTPRFFNHLGTIQGGWASTILDAAMGFATHSTMKEGEGFTTVEMKINFVRPILPSSGIVRCEGKIIHRGGRMATSEAHLLDEGGKLLAHGSETCMIFPPETAERR